MRVVIMNLFFVLIPSIVACQETKTLPAAVQSAKESITEASLRSTLEHLASDKMKGRETGSAELREAGRYLAERCKKAGLMPLFSNSYFQGEVLADPTRFSGSITSAGKQKALLKASDFLAGGPCDVEAEEGDIVFWKGSWAKNNADRAEFVKGKVVILIPDGGRSADARQAMLLNRWRMMLEEEGAIAVLVTGMKQDNKLPASAGIPMIRLPENLERMIPTSTDVVSGLGLKLSVPASEDPASFNVGAFLEGSDPSKQAEIIAFSAHLDHIGVSERGIGADRINNGADDDASGCTAVLAIAEAMAKLELRPERSTIFLWFYGEERGFLGSRYYVKNPGRPLAHHRALFNLEMLGRPDDIKPNEAWITGWNVSDFGEILSKSTKDSGIRFYEHPQRSRMLFGSSDNIVFAQAGVPAHSISAGSLHKDYHQVTDEASKIDFPNMTRVTRGLFHTGWLMANGGPLPTYNEGTKYAEASKALLEK
jgi:hypothetical protein